LKLGKFSFDDSADIVKDVTNGDGTVLGENVIINSS